MKALTLHQPWATLIAIGAKQYETRSWATGYRGPIAIHAAKAMPPQARRLVFEEPFYSALHKAGLADIPVPGLLGVERLPQSAIVAVTNLVDVLPICGTQGVPVAEGRFSVTPLAISAQERALGDWTPGRYAWQLANVRRLPDPIPCKGAQGLWTLPAEIAEQIARVAQ